jgi:7-cyano-7-deazaguanine reductase
MAEAEGMKLPMSPESDIRSDLLEPAPFESPEQLIHIETDEFSAVCPWSGLPDIAHIEIDYYPTGGLIVELKSLKYYFVSYRPVGVYQERATQLIREHLEQKLKCPIQVTSIYHTRGGIDVTCTEGTLMKQVVDNPLKEE